MVEPVTVVTSTACDRPPGRSDGGAQDGGVEGWAAVSVTELQ